MPWADNLSCTWHKANEKGRLEDSTSGIETNLFGKSTVRYNSLDQTKMNTPNGEVELEN